MNLEAGGFGAFTDSFEDLGRLKQLPGLAVQRLMADGYGFGGEGDWKTAILVRVANVMGAGLPGGASLMEDYTYDLVPGSASNTSRTGSSRPPMPRGWISHVGVPVAIDGQTSSMCAPRIFGVPGPKW